MQIRKVFLVFGKIDLEGNLRKGVAVLAVGFWEALKLKATRCFRGFEINGDSLNMAKKTSFVVHKVGKRRF